MVNKIHSLNVTKQYSTELVPEIAVLTIIFAGIYIATVISEEECKASVIQRAVPRINAPHITVRYRTLSHSTAYVNEMLFFGSVQRKIYIHEIKL